MEALYSRKQFFRATLRQGLKGLSRRICGDEAGSNCVQTNLSSDYHSICSDFPPDLLRLEAKRLEINPEAFGSEDLLRAVYEAMKAQHLSAGNSNDDSS